MATPPAAPVPAPKVKFPFPPKGAKPPVKAKPVNLKDSMARRLQK